ncbi:uncharacterized protein Gasu_45020 [Galdieria sulphuraria]|uniref:Uncharacterized protein n=1 Tax=Galdieria sulphuraria TaxID=130081 RepID=M2VXK5_GALSU|nr:uncharacterized protein Gasu_45020 [Galdieria sulphuraria]EME28001.1 hypothetical protein Gasu_45020 [Galdieria sulphuraria]|eukprot:XP_005704521.1 hypothetical protein Gasu_45020 [Galdieria sulphuraria]
MRDRRQSQGLSWLFVPLLAEYSYLNRVRRKSGFNCSTLHLKFRRLRFHVNVSKMEAAGSRDTSLLIIGAGELGKRIAFQWKSRFASQSRVVGETRTSRNHSELNQMGVEPRLRQDPQPEPFSYVVFCASPRGNSSYVDEVRRAISLWKGDGNFVFTSSGSVYQQNNGEMVDERTATASVQDSNASSQALLIACENEVLQSGGNVIRLAGLYSKERGAHAYWLRTGQVKGNPTALVNLIHYDDAANLVICVLCRQDLRSEILLGCDSHPISKQDICRWGQKLDIYRNLPFPSFVDNHDSGKGKIYNNTFTRTTLSEWSCKYKSFEDFVVQQNSSSVGNK